MQWVDVQGAAFVEHKIKGLRMRRLDLIGDGKGSGQSISCTGAPGNPSADPEAAAHLRLVADILDRLVARSSGFEIEMEEYGRARWMMFVIGLLSAASAVGLFVLALVTGVPGDKLGAASVPFIILFVFGGLLMAKHAPWRPVLRGDAALFSQALRQVLEPEGP